MKTKSNAEFDRHPFHSMCSYIGCFPPRVPRMILENWVGRRTTVIDPFCGSGTTLVEAQFAGSRAVGVDLNPLAIAITRAKLAPVSHDDVLFRLNEISREFRGHDEDEDVPDGIRIIYHPRTLAQLCYLRRVLDPSRHEDTLLIGALLGIMHGKFRRDGTTAYLSIDMPNTFSMSPNYVRGFVRKHRLRQAPADVFAKLRQRLDWLYRQGPIPARAPSLVVEGDATRLPDLLERHGVRPGAIVTSPPYLGILRYGAFNWIRLWLLREEQYRIDRILDGTDSFDRYLGFMASFLRAASEVMPVDAPVALVIGDVVENEQYVRLAERVWEELGGLLPFDLVRLEANRFDVTTKTTRIWGEEKKGRATPVDRILVLKRRSRVTRRPRGRLARTG